MEIDVNFKNQNKHWALAILCKIKDALLAIWHLFVKCFKWIGDFIKKRWKIFVGLFLFIIVVLIGVCEYNYYKYEVLPKRTQNKAIDNIEVKLHSNDKDSVVLCAYEILQKKHSDNFEKVIYYDDIKYHDVRERFSVLMKEAFCIIEDGAYAGNAKYQYALSLIYYFENNLIKEDLTKSAYWANEAAQQGYVNAYNSIGLAYKKGEGVKIDMRLAVEWLKKGAEAGEAYAQKNYGDLFVEGVKIEVGTHKKLKEGYNPRLYDKYDRYAWEDVPDYEILLPKDIEQAKYWWKKAAEQGHKGAKNALQKIYN